MAAVVTAFTAYVLVHEPAPVMANVMAEAEDAAGSAGVSEDPTLLYVLGDEFSSDETARFDEKGEQMLGTARDWPAMVTHELDWDLVSDTSTGSGYLTPGGGGTIGDRAAAVDRGADVVVLAGGGHDVPEHSVAEVSAAVEGALVALLNSRPTAEIVLTSPLPRDAGEESVVPAASTDELCKALRVLAGRHHVAFVDLSASVAARSEGSSLHEMVAARILRTLRELDAHR